MNKTTLVIVELNDGALSRQSLEAISAAQSLDAKKLVVAIAGKGTTAAMKSLQALAVNEICQIEHALLEHYSCDGFCKVLEQAIKHVQPDLILLPHSYQVRDFLPVLATRFNRSIISDCIAFNDSDTALTFVRPLFQGRVSANTLALDETPVFVTLQNGSFSADSLIKASVDPTVYSLNFDLSNDDIRSTSELPFRIDSQSVDLSKADVIVAVGRGIKSADNIPLAKSLADLLGGELAASRPICDEGWLPIDRQVGTSGQSVAPKFYFALGISGAIQHVIGMKAATTVVAINNDANAPIFKIADYGIVADLFEIVPALVKHLQEQTPAGDS